MATDETGRAFAVALTEIMFAEAIVAHEVGDPLARFQEIEAGAEDRYGERLAQWERNEPMRLAGQQAFERAMRQRRAELGQPAVGRIAACLDRTRPVPPSRRAIG